MDFITSRISTVEKIKHHFEEEAWEFDQIILRLIPHYAEMTAALVDAIPFGGSDPIRVIDLGCGTGTIAKYIKKTFPRAKITCLDMAENMIQMARMKLSGKTEIGYRICDFSCFEFDEKYDAVLSSLALHHLDSNEDKKKFYSRIYDSLNPSGIFLNADVVLASSEPIQALYMQKWITFMRKNVSEEEINTKWIPKYYEEDRPARLMDQLHWLGEIGYTDVDVIWKYYNFAVYGGVKKVK
jgi:tRNA (cmo5U34)-methyltransferase